MTRLSVLLFPLGAASTALAGNSTLTADPVSGGPDNFLSAEASIDLRIYRFGGSSAASAAIASASYYDAEKDSWVEDDTSVLDMPEPLTKPGAAAIDSSIYLFGGSSTDGTASAALRQFDTVKNTYAERAKLPMALSAVSASHASDSSTVFYGSMVTPGLFTYDPTTDVHKTINDEQVNCLSKTYDGSRVYGVFDSLLHSIDSATGEISTVSDEQVPSTPTGWNSCGMTSDGSFYFLADQDIFFMDTSPETDQKWFAAVDSGGTATVPEHHESDYTGLILEDLLVITSHGYTDLLQCNLV
jgi:hypothetical protein